MNGLFFGKFAPLTKGHVYAISRAAAQVDNLYVVLCWDEKFQNTQTPYMQSVLTKSNRMLWLKNTFKECPNIHITYVDETPIPPYPDGESEFTNLVLMNFIDTYKHCVIHKVFSSENMYEPYFKKHWPGADHIMIDPERSVVPISATQFRNDPLNNMHFLSVAARKDFVKKVCIIGIESTGKSTMTKMLANHYSTDYVEEVGRTICEDEYGESEEFMTVQHYERIAMEHKLKENRVQKHANKVMFSDTNNLITLFSMECQGKTSKMIWEMAKAEKYDLVIMLDKNVPWVSDPLRTNSTNALRNKTHTQLKQLCKDLGVEYVMISSTEYDDRFRDAVQLVDKLLEIK